MGRPADLLATHLLPTVLHGLGNHTQFLTGLRAVLEMAPGGSILHDKAGDLADVSARVEDTGWALAMLASAAGSDLLLARRERRALEIVGDLVKEALRRAGAAPLVLPDGFAWPQVEPHLFEGDGGWQLPWSLGSLLLAAGLDASEGAPGFDWALEPQPDGARFRVSGADRVAAVAALVAERLPGTSSGASTGASIGTFELHLPRGWLDFTAGA